jgi:energy-coupling factor transporter ATP-binding protein EcfA2
LDETISNLDDYGKEKLVEMLLEEKNTNTIIVSHDYEHPLVDKLNVIKEKNISRLER